MNFIIGDSRGQMFGKTIENTSSDFFLTQGKAGFIITQFPM